MKNAGCDCGGTLTKFYWSDKHGENFRSTADLTLGEIVEELAAAGISRLHVTGIGARPATDSMEIIDLASIAANPVDSEIRIQVRGIERLLQPRDSREEPFLLVSVGTGISYTLVSWDGHYKYPWGNPIGSRTFSGLGELLGIKSEAEMFSLANEGETLDLCFGHLIPALATEPHGAMIVGHFGRISPEHCGIEHRGIVHVLRNQLHLIATSIVVDILKCADFRPPAPHVLPEEIVFTGTIASRSVLFRAELEAMLAMIGKRAVFPEHAEFAGAIGAFHEKVTL